MGDMKRDSDLGKERGESRNSDRRVHPCRPSVRNVHWSEIVEPLRGANQPARHTEPKCPRIARGDDIEFKVDRHSANESRTNVNTEWSQVGGEGKGRSIRIEGIAL